MADVELVIKIPEKVYEARKKKKCMLDEVDIAIANGTPLPKDATNGDVFMTMFPNLIWHSVRGDLIGKTSVDMPIGDRWQKNMFYCDTDWWEAPYKESKDE